MELTANRVYRDLIEQIKSNIEKDVESVHYRAAPLEYLMYCHIHMKNGMVIEGTGLLLRGTDINSARDVARRNAMKTIVTIAQYILADDLHIEAQLGCGETQFANQLKGTKT